MIFIYFFFFLKKKIKKKNLGVYQIKKYGRSRVSYE